MPDLFDLITRWWKHMLTVVLLAVLVAGAVIFLKPGKYLSVATAIPASSYASDKARVFNDNIQQLYSTLGTPDDLDAVVGIAGLDTVYLSVAEQLKLPDHYKVKEQGNAAFIKAAYCLKKNTRVYKSEFGNLKVKVWDADKNIAPLMANAIMKKLDLMYQDIQSISNKTTLEGLFRSRDQLQKSIDSGMGSPENEPALRNQVQQYDNKISEYRQVLENKPPALIVIENARVAEWPDKPPRTPLLVSAAVLGFFFSLLLAIILEKRRKREL